jgi:hypothetical protein
LRNAKRRDFKLDFFCFCFEPNNKHLD